ncbi:hypothetical protein BDF22DRAFT_678048, partial [Syncephalis plumigaleata]
MRCSTVIITILVVVLSSVVQEREAAPVHLAPRSAAPAWHDDSSGSSWWEKDPDGDAFGEVRRPVFGMPHRTSYKSIDAQMKLKEVKKLVELMKAKLKEWKGTKEKELKELRSKEFNDLKLQKKTKEKELKEMQELKLDDVKLDDL